MFLKFVISIYPSSWPITLDLHHKFKVGEQQTIKNSLESCLPSAPMLLYASLSWKAPLKTEMISSKCFII